MTPTDYQKAAIRTAAVHDNPNLDIAILAMGLAGETGETVDYLKKVIGHGHTLDRDKVADELGDICWYIAVLADHLGIRLEHILERNVAKLVNRYPAGFSTEASVNRPDGG